MTDEDREALAEALHERLCRPLTGDDEPCQACRDDADALQPAVDTIARRRAAEELRELAGSLESRARLFPDDAAPLQDAALKARDRADALETT